MIYNQFFVTEEIYRNTFTYLIGEERLTVLLEKKGGIWLFNTKRLLLELILKIPVISLSILIGFVFFRVHIPFKLVLTSVITAEYIMLIPVVLKFIWFFFFEELIAVGDFERFAPWSLRYYLDSVNIHGLFRNLSYYLNLFYALFISLIAYKIAQKLKLSFLKSVGYALVGYLPCLIIFVTLTTYILKIIS